MSGSERSKLSARTRLSSQAAPFQPQIAAATAGPAGRGHSTAFYAAAQHRTTSWMPSSRWLNLSPNVKLCRLLGSWMPSKLWLNT